MVYGTPTGNLWLKQYIVDLPVRIEPDRILVDKPYEGTHLRFITAWPNPENPQYPVVIYTAQQAEDVININSVFHGPTDYVVAQGRKILVSGNYIKQQGIWSLKERSK